MELTKTKTQVHPIIKQRWSPRAFSAEPISDEKLMSILEAGRLAPSSYNIQPWRFIFAKREDEKDFERLFGTLMKPNKVWAKDASLLILSIAQNHEPSSGDENPYAVHDVGLAVENMVLQAESVGVKAHQMGGFHADKAQADLEIPNGFEPVTVTAFGYPGHPEDLPEGFYENEIQTTDREPLDQLFFKGSYGVCS